MAGVTVAVAVAWERTADYTPTLDDAVADGAAGGEQPAGGLAAVADGGGSHGDGAVGHDDALGDVRAAVDRLLDIRPDELGDGQLARELEVLEPIRRRLEARVARSTSTVTGRAERRARRLAVDGGQGDEIREGRRAAQDARKALAGRLGWSTRDANRTDDDGRRLEAMPRAAAAADDGRLSARHARILANTLRYLHGPQRDALEAELVEAAATQDPTTFGRTARRRLGEIDPDALRVDHDLRHQRRRATATRTDDGTLHLEGRWTGLDAETIQTALHAFRRPDAPHSTARTPGQRTADALVAVARAALDAATAPTDRGARPHVNLTIPIRALEQAAGIAEGSWSGPICLDTLREVLDDVGLAWIVTDDAGLPMQAGPEVRTVPRALWRALRQRDGGCIRAGCDAPPSWTDVMHLDRSFAEGGRLNLDNAALGCRADHRLYDNGRLELSWNDGRPTLHPPDPDTEDPHRPRDGPAP